MKKKQLLTKNKAQLIADLQKNQDWVKKMLFTKTQFYPALLDLDSSVDDVKMFLASIETVLMEKFLAKMKETKFIDMKLVDVLDPTDEKYQWYIKILSLFEDMNTYDARDVIDGMRKEIAQFETDESKNKKLVDLKTKWLDEL